MIFFNPVLEDKAKTVIKDLTQQFLEVSKKYQIKCEET
jgi:hypothetical protein